MHFRGEVARGWNRPTPVVSGINEIDQAEDMDDSATSNSIARIVTGPEDSQ